MALELAYAEALVELWAWSHYRWNEWGLGQERMSSTLKNPKSPLELLLEAPWKKGQLI